MAAEQDSLTRQVEGRALPQMGQYEIDPAHTVIEASVRHLVVAKVRGRFTRFTGTIDVAEQARDSSATIEIDATSIDTGDQTRDDHMRSPDFLDAETHPKLTFRSRTVEPADSPDSWRVTGDFTVRGVTREVVLDTEFLGAMIDHRDRHRIAFSATTRLEREDYGITWNQALEAGGVLVGKTLDIALEVQAVKAG